MTASSARTTVAQIPVVRRVVSGIMMALGVSSSGAPAEDAGPRITAVRPTVLFAASDTGLQRQVDITVENPAEPVQAGLLITLGPTSVTRDLGLLAAGSNEFRIPVPDVRTAVPAEFVLKTGDRVSDRHAMEWQPGRHWRVCFVPITHHDLGYTDTIGNVLADYDRFYDQVLDFCAETDDWEPEARYRYTMEGTWSAQHYLRNRSSETAQRLGRYIREGRIEVGALFGNQISGLCGHEELIRLLYPSFRFRREYGAEILSGSITDVPGLSWGLPTVLAGSGVKYFFAGLPTYFEWGRSKVHPFWDEEAVLRHGRPDAFRWQGPDGSDVLVYYQGSYGFFNKTAGPDSYDEVLEHLPGKLADLEEQGSPFDVMRYIHNGVDNHPPDVEISRIVRQWNRTWAYPKLIVATNSMFFKALEEQCGDVRTFRGELPHTDYAVGAASTALHTGINRRTHDKLATAETAAALASLVTDFEYPRRDIGDAYDNMLLYDEHTWGKAYPIGEVQDLAWHEKSGYALRAAALTEEVLSESLDRIARSIDLPERRAHIVVFNGLSHERTDVVRVTRFSHRGAFELIDTDTGQPVPYGIEELDNPLAPLPYAAHRYARGKFSRGELADLVFVAERVPSLGYKTYKLAPVRRAPQFTGEVNIGPFSLENRFYRVTLDEETGAVTSIYDKIRDCERVDPDSEHGVNRLVGKWVETGEIEASGKATVRAGAAGPVRASLVVETAGPGCPRVTQEISLYDGIPRIDFANRVLKDSTPLLEIYFAFPFRVEVPRFRFEGTNSVIEPLRDQFPGSNTNYYSVQHWADVSDDRSGVTLSGPDSHLMEFGGLWPCYVSQAHHGLRPPDYGRPFIGPDQLGKGHIYAFVMDSNFRTNFQPVQQGDMLFRYSLTTHEGDWRQGRSRDFGRGVCQPLIGVLADGGRRGPLPGSAGFCALDRDHCTVLTIKRAEDGPDLIVRVTENEGRATDLRLTFGRTSIEEAWLCTTMEEARALLPHTENTVTVPMGAFAIRTVRIRVADETGAAE